MSTFLEMLMYNAPTNMESFQASLMSIWMHAYDILVEFLSTTSQFALEYDLIELLDLSTHALQSLAHLTGA